MSKGKNTGSRRDTNPYPQNVNSKIKIMQRHEGKVLIEMDEKYFESMLNCMEGFLIQVRPCIVAQTEFIDEIEFSNTSNQVSEVKSRIEVIRTDVREAQDFRRRIPHFFMGRFKKWSKIHNHIDVHEFLKVLQQHKKSKQGRFELGDFHKTFIIDQTDDPPTQLIKAKLKNLFIDFLQNEAVLQIIQYGKITSLEQKLKYIDVIPDLVHELFEDKPFESFLAQENIQKALDKKRAYDMQQSLYTTPNSDQSKGPFA